MIIATKFVISAALLLFGQPALGQRSSPQFSFPPPGPVASPFGSDIFGPTTSNNQQDLGQPQGVGQQNSQPSPFGSLGAFEQPPPPPPAPQQSQFAPLQPVAAPQPVPAPLPAPKPDVVQLTRPSLSLSSLSTLGQPQQPQSGSHSQHQSHQSQQVPQQPQSQRSSQASSVAAPSSIVSSTSQASRNRQVSSQQASHNNNHNHNNNQHQTSNKLQTQATSQSLNGQNNQAAIETARRAEASAASLAASSGQTYQCPDSFGYFRHHKSCDKYWACENGTSTLKLCGNGLMFDDSDPRRENCAYPFSVDCGADRTDLEPPISTPHCPRLYGLFADSANCRIFYSCWNGESSKYECPPGLAYDNEQRVCVWADTVDRCDQSEVSDGFVCPDPTEVDQPGHYTRHAHPTDCRKFYVCIEGVARPYGCSLGTVFNVDSLQCDEPENVSGCEKYYGDMDPKLAKKLARENSQANSGNQQQQTGQGSSSASSSSRGLSAANQPASH